MAINFSVKSLYYRLWGKVVLIQGVMESFRATQQRFGCVRHQRCGGWHQECGGHHFNGTSFEDFTMASSATKHRRSQHSAPSPSVCFDSDDLEADGPDRHERVTSPIHKVGLRASPRRSSARKPGQHRSRRSYRGANDLGASSPPRSRYCEHITLREAEWQVYG